MKEERNTTMKNYLCITTLLICPLTASAVNTADTVPQSGVFLDEALKKTAPESSPLKKIILDDFKTLTDLNATAADCAQHVAKNYVQKVNSEVLDYDGFIDHMKALKKTVKSIKITFHDMLEDGNKVVTRHTARGIKNDNSVVEMDVIAIFEIQDGKLVSCNELTHLVEGSKADQDLGSRK
jgi:ketosteroid isomerase-like protein